MRTSVLLAVLLLLGATESAGAVVKRVEERSITKRVDTMQLTTNHAPHSRVGVDVERDLVERITKSGKGGKSGGKGGKKGSGKGGKGGKGGGKKGGKGNVPSSQDMDSDCCSCECDDGKCHCICDCDESGGKGKSGKSGKKGSCGKSGKKGSCDDGDDDDGDDDDDDDDDGDDDDDDEDDDDEDNDEEHSSSGDGSSNDAPTGPTKYPTAAPTPTELAPTPPTAAPVVHPTAAPTTDLYRTVSCDGTVPENAVVVEVSYIYSVAFKDVSVDQAMRHIEEETLNAVAAAFLAACLDDASRRRRLNTVVGVSALPEDKEIASCGEDCSDVDGGMTLYVADDGNSDMTALQCQVLDIIRETMDNMEAEFIDEVTMIDEDELDCEAGTVGGVPPALIATSTEATDDDDVPVAAIAGGIMGAVLLAFFLFLVLRRRPNSQEESTPKELMSVSTEGSVSRAYQMGYDDGYDYREKEWQNRGGLKGQSSSNAQPTPPSRSEMESRAFALGFSDAASVDAYCDGFLAGYMAAAGVLLDVHKCASASCPQCHQDGKNELKFVALPKNYNPKLSRQKSKRKDGSGDESAYWSEVSVNSDQNTLT